MSKKEKNKLPIYLCILIVLVGIFIVFINKDKWFSKKETNEQSTKVESKLNEEKKKEKEKQTTTEKIPADEQQIKEEKIETPTENTNQETQQTSSQPAREEQPQVPVQNPSPSPSPEPIIETPPAVNELELTPGTALYLYKGEGNSIELNGIGFEYVSFNSSVLNVNVTINGSMKNYNITIGQETRLSNLKNPILIDEEEEYFKIRFR